MNDLLGIIVLLVSIMGWCLILIAYSRTEDLVVLVMVHCVVVFIRRLMCRFMPMRRIWHAVGGLQSGAALIDTRLYTGPITGAREVEFIARVRWRNENNITLGSSCRGRLRPALDAGGSRPPRHQ
jgi:hypothetical protein